MDILEGLNLQQKRAVTAPQGPVLVLAGPGSGKTRVLTHRIAYLVDHQEIPLRDILAVTFTNKASREMGGRVNLLLGEADRESGMTVESTLLLGTFHAFCAGVLRREADVLPFKSNFSIFDDSDQLSLVRQALGRLNVESGSISPSKVHGAISLAKNELIEPDEFASTTYFAEIAQRTYSQYQKLLLENNALDFDDLLLWTVRLLTEHDDLRLKYQYRFPHILVDEFQDTNSAQYKLLHLLAGDQSDLFVVGDPDQSIYRWRGADYRNILRFQEDYPGAEVFLLEHTYRSTQNILDVAMAVIDQNPNRQPKKLVTARGAGSLVQFHQVYDEGDEAALVVEMISSLTANGEVGLGDCAVMYRTNAQSLALEEAFNTANIPYRVVGAQRFYGRREVKDLIAYLRVIQNPDDQAALLRILNTPRRGIGAKTLETLLNTAEANSASLTEIILDLAIGEPSRFSGSLGDRALNSLRNFGRMFKGWLEAQGQIGLVLLIDRVLEESGYREFILDDSRDGEDRWSHIQELRGRVLDEPDLDLATFLERVSLISDQDTLTESRNAPSLLTLHSSKGLEFEVVFIIGLDEGVLPHQRSTTPEELAEERRLFYVGVTRAKDRLILVRAMRRRIEGLRHEVEPSPYLYDLPPDRVEGILPGLQTREQIGYRRQTSWTIPTPTTFEPQLKVGMRVHHPSFGEGFVMASEIDHNDQIVTISFDQEDEFKHLLASSANLKILEEG